METAKTVGEDAASDSGQVEFALACHANLQGMVQLADAKAAAIVGLQGLVVALLGSNLIDRLAAETQRSPWLMLLIGGGTLFCSLASLVLAIMVLVPRVNLARHVTVPSDLQGLMWIDDLAKMGGDVDEYGRRLHSLTPLDAVRNIAHENLKIAAILRAKFAFLPWSLRFVALASLGWAALLVWALQAKQVCT